MKFATQCIHLHPYEIKLPKDIPLYNDLYLYILILIYKASNRI